MKKSVKRVIIIAAMVALMPVLAIVAREQTRCRYCNSTNYGSCQDAPHKVHEHIDDCDHCEFCGSMNYGSCQTAPNKVHRHGHGKNKCVWCGSTNTGSCSTSPFKRHEK